jgi:CheY-like chemotaxis protein
MTEERKFFRLTSAGRSLWATRKKVPLPLEYRRILGLVDYAGHVEVIRSELARYPRKVVNEWLSEFEAKGLIEAIAAGEVKLSEIARRVEPPPIPAEDLPFFDQDVSFADISLSQLGVYVAHDRVANRPPTAKRPCETSAIIVEDDADQRALGLVRLTAAGYAVAAVNGVKALYRTLEQCTPDAIFLDVNLDDGSGFDVLATLRLHPSFAHMPIIMLTARSDPEDIARGLSLGADAYVTKPYGPNTLDYVLRYVLKQEIEYPAAAAAV